jgi:hypothetical protein
VCALAAGQCPRQLFTAPHPSRNAAPAPAPAPAAEEEGERKGGGGEGAGQAEEAEEAEEGAVGAGAVAEGEASEEKEPTAPWAEWGGLERAGRFGGDDACTGLCFGAGGGRAGRLYVASQVDLPRPAPSPPRHRAPPCRVAAGRRRGLTWGGAAQDATVRALDLPAFLPSRCFALGDLPLGALALLPPTPAHPNGPPRAPRPAPGVF